MGTPRNRPFRIENSCLSHPKFNSNIDKWWIEDLNIQGTKMYLLQQKLKHIKSHPKAWNKPKEKLSKNFRRLIRSSSQKVLPRNGKFRLTLFRMNGTIGACKRRFSRDRNRGCSGLEKEKGTRSFFIDQPWIIDHITKFQNLNILKGKSSSLTNKWNLS